MGKLNEISILLLLSLIIVSAGCSKDVFVEPKSDLSTSNSSIYISSNPPGSTIYINGKTTGKVTPDTIKWLNPGNCRVTLKRNLYWDTTFTINASLENINSILIDYFRSDRMLGSIICISKPLGAKIYLDNVNTGKVTPATLTRLIPQNYSVKYEYPEYRKDSVNVSLSSMSSEYVSIVLDDTLDVIKYTSANSGIPIDYTTGIGEDKQGNIWIGTGNRGLLKYDGKNFINYTSSNSSFIKSDFVTKVKSDNERNIWVGFSNGLSKYDGISWNTITTNAISSIQVLPDNSILAGNDRAGLIKYSNGAFSFINNENSGIPSNDIVSAIYDIEGNLWAAFRSEGIAVYKGSQWSMIDPVITGMPYVYCSGLNLTKDGRILALFYNRPNDASPMAAHTLALYQNGTWFKLWTNFTAWMEDKDLYVDQNNKTWVSFMNPEPTMMRISNGNSYKEFFNNSILHSGIRKFTSWLYDDITRYFFSKQVFIDSKGNLWLHGYMGVVKVKAGRWNN